MAGTKSNGTSPKRWRPRFSLRTLVIFVTLVCFYFGAWEATKNFGVPAVSEFIETTTSGFCFPVDHADSPFPFCVRVDQGGVESIPGRKPSFAYYRRSYSWIFGWIIHWKDEEVQIDDRIRGGVI
jgi:hypothetical protein